MTLTVGSLFSGIGGLDLGLERAGMRVAWQAEAEFDDGKLLPRQANAELLARRFPGVPNYGDVRGVHGRDVARVDVLCGGFPCQDLSVAGSRAGLAGQRSGLFHEFMRIAAEVAPTWVLIENVPGLLSSNDGRDMGTVLGVLADLGYGWAYRVLDAQYLGVAQRRRRVFIVGCLGDAARAASVLLEPESCAGDSPPSREARESVAGTLAPGTHGRGANGYPGEVNHLVSDVVPALVQRYGKGTDSDASDALLPIAFMWQAGGNNDASGAFADDFSPTLPRHQTVAVAYSTKLHNTESNGAGKFYEEYAPSPCHPLAAGAHPPAIAYDAYNHIPTQDLAGTLSGGDAGNRMPHLFQGMAVRRLTPMECERLQGFPDRWTEGFPDSTRYRMLGNAVCVPNATWLGRRMASIDAQERAA